jgi:hypothetical protein
MNSAPNREIFTKATERGNFEALAAVLNYTATKVRMPGDITRSTKLTDETIAEVLECADHFQNYKTTHPIYPTEGLGTIEDFEAIKVMFLSLQKILNKDGPALTSKELQPIKRNADVMSGLLFNAILQDSPKHIDVANLLKTSIYRKDELQRAVAIFEPATFPSGLM